ncbi:hypothetical protein HNR42_002154 [Deinobacterium chartae]|uniref:Uncharacterized protein n=1 Tax=Deinobacterium chartae TaxID=521158 RepID=A0A841I2X1_9DEIO|nr:hypothetical protein [Deinobacterium chartae]MBB6098719.1 hypothetical protein [Deinobacterium chartae]
MQQIRKILEMVRNGRLSDEDAARLLTALSGRLQLSESTWNAFFGLLREGEFSVEELSGLLELRAGVRRSATAHVSMGGMGSLGQDIENMTRQITGLVGHRIDRAMSGPRPGTLLRIEIETADGGQVRANLPLALAEHATKLLPQQALQAISAQGLDLEALRLLLTSQPPVGPLIELEGADGTQVRLRVE